MNEGGWTTADYALIVSLSSAAIALISLGWSIWAVFIFPKPKLKVWVGMSYCDFHSGHIISQHSNGFLPGNWSVEELTNPSISFSMVNRGPGDIKLQCAIARKGIIHRHKKDGHALLNPYNNYPSDLSGKGPFAAGLPKTVVPNETYSVYFPVEEGWFVEMQFERFGFLDSLGRKHYCSVKDARTLRRSVRNFTRGKP